MTNAQTNVVVLKAEVGGYLLLPQETLEQGRVPEEHTALAIHSLTGGGPA